jgi:hypothetical protein
MTLGHPERTGGFSRRKINVRTAPMSKGEDLGDLGAVPATRFRTFRPTAAGISPGRG